MASFPLAQPSEVRRITRLLIGAPELRPLGAALLGVWACAGCPALGAGGVVLLVGPVGCGPVSCLHGSRNEKAPTCGAVDRQSRGWALACRGASGRGVTLAATLLRDAVCALNGAGKL